MANFLILAENSFQDEELFCVFYRLKEEGLSVEIASSQVGQLKGKHGISCEATKALANVSVNDYVGIYIPGGFESPENLRVNSSALNIVKTFVNDKKIVAAMCHGVWVLISAKVVAGKKMTCYPKMRDDLINAGALYNDVPAVRDGSIITGRRPRDLSEFCTLLVSSIKSV